jgi:hypothetical protein
LRIVRKAKILAGRETPILLAEQIDALVAAEDRRERSALAPVEQGSKMGGLIVAGGTSCMSTL